jgi:small subunit ribosomal protein S9
VLRCQHAIIVAGMDKVVCIFCRHARPRMRPRAPFRPAVQALPNLPRAYTTTTEFTSTNGQEDLPIFSGEVYSSTQTRIDQGDKSALQNLRVVPKSAAYFSSKPQSIDRLLELQTLLRRYETLPTVKSIDAPRVAWKTLVEVRAMNGGEKLRPTRYHKVLNLLKRLRIIHPELMPQEVEDKMAEYKRAVQPALVQAKPKILDDLGRAKGVGRRKSASAVAWLVEGEGQVLVNGKNLAQYFDRLHHRESAVWALKATKRLDRYNAFILTRGGGHTGQAEAITLAIGKALLVHEPELKKFIRVGKLQSHHPPYLSASALRLYPELPHSTHYFRCTFYCISAIHYEVTRSVSGDNSRQPDWRYDIDLYLRKTAFSIHIH